MRVLIRTAAWNPERTEWCDGLVDELAAQGATPEPIRDEHDGTGASKFERAEAGFDVFDAALEAQGEDDCWHMEDDVLLTTGFVAKARAVAFQHRPRVIQAFSRRRADVDVGSRFEPGRTFGMTQCFYLPGAIAQPMLAYSKVWRATFTVETRRGLYPTYDTMAGDFLAERGIRYWLLVPNLVDHRNGGRGSLIGSPGGRGSLTFVP